MPLKKKIGESLRQGRAKLKLGTQAPARATPKKKTPMQRGQASLNHIAARGNAAKAVDPMGRTEQHKKDINAFLRALGTPSKAWEEEKRVNKKGDDRSVPGYAKGGPVKGKGNKDDKDSKGKKGFVPFWAKGKEKKKMPAKRGKK